MLRVGAAGLGDGPIILQVIAIISLSCNYKMQLNWYLLSALRTYIHTGVEAIIEKAYSNYNCNSLIAIAIPGGSQYFCSQVYYVRGTT